MYRANDEVYSLRYIGLSNFMLIRCIVLKIWRFEFFVDLAWNSYSRPQNFGFWGSEPLNVIGHHRDPQKAHPWLKPHLHMPILVQIGPLVRPGRVLKKSKKKKKRRGKKLTVANWVFAQTTHVDAAIGGLACRVVFGFQVSSKSGERFSSCGGRKLPFPILKASGLYNSLYYRTSRDLQALTLCLCLCSRQRKPSLLLRDPS